MGPDTMHHGIPSLELAHLRDMLILSLPRENVSLYQDRRMLDQYRYQQRERAGSRPSSAAREDREVRLKNLKERQNEERQKKLEEIKAQALAAQRYKEQKEAERKQRFEELRMREDTRRQQVEERKRAINEAERDRLDAILRRNQEREARIEARKRSDRHSMVFAFGSSTPRMLDPAPEAGTFWGHRRATSTQNITCMSVPAGAPGTPCATTLTRRQSERELDGGSKKRATSAGGLERSGEDQLRMTSSMYEIFGCGQSTPGRGTNLLTRSSSAHFGTPPTTPAGCVSGYVGRRRTDLMPTIPTKDSSPGGGGGGSGIGTPRNKAFARSPGRAYSMSRLDQLSKPRKQQRAADQLPPVSELAASRPLHHHHHSQTQYATVSRSMSHLAGVGRPSTAGSATSHGLLPQRPLRKADSRSMHQLSVATPVPPPRATRATQLRQQRLASASAGGGMNEASSRPSSALSQQSTTSVASSVNMRVRPIAAPRRPRPASIAVTGVSSSVDKSAADKTTKPPLPKSRKSSLVKSQEKLKKKPLASPTEPSTPKVASPTTHAPPALIAAPANQEDISMSHTKQVEQSQPVPVTTGQDDSQAVKTQPEEVNNVQVDTQQEKSSSTNLLIDLEPSTPMKEVPLAPVVVDEMKAEPVEVKEPAAAPALAAIVTTSVEKSELVSNNETVSSVTAPSDGEQQELVDMTASMIRVRINTEEEAKAALAERRRLAREEAERQAEAERLRIEEENRLEFEHQQREEEQQRLLIEQMRAAEQERLEEAIRETQRREEEERLRREEEMRQKLLKEEADRKAREEAERQKAELAERLKHEEKEREARRKRVEAIMLRTRGKNNAPQQTDEKNAENSENSEKVNGSNSENSENGHKNGKEIETVDNIIPVETLKNANTVNVDTLSTDDTLNSNNSWQHNNQQSDLLM